MVTGEPKVAPTPSAPTEKPPVTVRPAFCTETPPVTEMPPLTLTSPMLLTLKTAVLELAAYKRLCEPPPRLLTVKTPPLETPKLPEKVEEAGAVELMTVTGDVVELLLTVMPLSATVSPAVETMRPPEAMVCPPLCVMNPVKVATPSPRTSNTRWLPAIASMRKKSGAGPFSVRICSASPTKSVPATLT